MSLLNPIRRRFPSFVLRASSSSHSRSHKSPYVFPGQNSSIRGDGAIRRTDPIGSTIEQVYSGVLSFVRRNYTRNLKNVDVAVTGIPLDLTTTYRPGARFGPKAIREASVQFAELKSFPGGIDLFEDLAVIDYGDCYFDLSRPASIPLAIEHHAKKIIDRNVFLLSLGTFSFFWIVFLLCHSDLCLSILGGDHYMTYPLLKAHAAKHGHGLSLIHFDAHCDTWPDDHSDGMNHGTMFHHAVKEGLIDPKSSIQIGIRTFNDDYLGMRVIDADWVHRHSPESIVTEIRKRVGNNRTYLTFDIDCLDPAFAPGTGTPVCGGLSTAQALAIIRLLTGMNFIGMDVVEVSPPYDHANITSLAAATIGYELLLLLRHKKMVEQSFHFHGH